MSVHIALVKFAILHHGKTEKKRMKILSIKVDPPCDGLAFEDTFFTSLANADRCPSGKGGVAELLVDFTAKNVLPTYSIENVVWDFLLPKKEEKRGIYPEDIH